VFPLLAIPVAGWISAQGLTSRIGHPDEWTAAYVHTIAANGFAAILALSLVSSAIVVAARAGSHPRAYGRFTALPLAILLNVVVGIAWVVTIATALGAFTWFEPMIALLLAGCAVFLCACAIHPDVVARQFARDRRAALRASRSLESAERHIRLVRHSWIAGVSVTTLLIGGLAVGYALPVRFANCEPDGIARAANSGTTLLTTINCGSFLVGGGAAEYRQLKAELISDRVTISTDGWQFAPLPTRLVVSISKNKD
jgi:hypothetical protein